MSDIPDGLRYSQDHLWVRRDPGSGVARIGITDFAQDSLGDVLDLALPKPGDAVQAGQACGTIESSKSISDLVAPVSGRVRTGNDDLARDPGLVNAEPYAQGWLFEVEADAASLDGELANLMDGGAYRSLVGA